MAQIATLQAAPANGCSDAEKKSEPTYRAAARARFSKFRTAAATTIDVNVTHDFSPKPTNILSAATTFYHRYSPRIYTYFSRARRPRTLGDICRTTRSSSLVISKWIGEISGAGRNRRGHRKEKTPPHHPELQNIVGHLQKKYVQTFG